MLNKMNIDVPRYTKEGLVYVWENGFMIRCKIDESSVRIEANKEGLISLARHILELTQEEVPEFTHIHLDKYNSLEEDSNELIIIKSE